MAIRLLIMMEDDFEGVYDFTTKAEANAFESGFGMAAGLLGSPRWSICTKVENQPWTIVDQEEPSQQKRLEEALAQARRWGHEV